MAKARDSQRSKLYAAERAAFPDLFASHKAGEQLTWEETQAFVRSVLDDPRWCKYIKRRHSSRVTSTGFVIKDGRGTSWARGGVNHINLPRWARNKIVICHELAHTACPPTHVIQPHGRDFASTYLKIVELFMGWDDRMKLVRAFSKHRVRTGSDEAEAEKRKACEERHRIAKEGGTVKVELYVQCPPGSGSDVYDVDDAIEAMRAAGFKAKVVGRRVLEKTPRGME